MRRLLVMVMLLVISGGCSGRAARIVPPSIDPATAGNEAIAEYDSNGNGQIDGQELDKVPSIKSALAGIDKNRDNQVSAEEIADHIKMWQETKIALIGCKLRVTLDGQALKDATVKLIPEKFLGPSVKSASGKTDLRGEVELTVDDPGLNTRRIGGVQTGFYRVQITTDGGKSIPAKYNTDTILGEEVAPGALCTATIVTYELKQR